MLIKTILNRIEKFKSFVYGECSFEQIGNSPSLIVEVAARKNAKGLCPECHKLSPSYDKQPLRRYQYVPLWNIPVYFAYAPRRINCKAHGIRVELLPWCHGKEQITKSYQLFLARWAKRLSWSETALIFGTSWETVYRSIKSVVDYGLANRSWEGVEQIGVDEISVFKGHRYLTCVYQIDKGMRRLLWCGKDRKAKTLLRFFRDFGKDRCDRLQFVCSDMWRPYLKVIKKKCVNALNILDRFHIAKKFNEAVDQVRRDEVKELKDSGTDNVLEKAKYILLKRPENLSNKQCGRLDELVKINLSSIKAYLLKEDWADMAMGSELKPMQKVAKMLRSHKELILNWFSVPGGLSSGPVEGLNNKAKLTIKKAYGFKTLDCLQIALYHQLGKLEEPPSTHRFC
jgi:transposase